MRYRLATAHEVRSPRHGVWLGRRNACSAAPLSFATLAVVALGLSACARRASDQSPSATSGRRAEVTEPGSGESRAATAGASRQAAARTPDSRVRPAQKAGQWYPGERAWATAEMDRMLRAAAEAPRLRSKPIALVVPHAGWSYSGGAAAAAYGQLNRGDFDRVVLLGPSHRSAFDGFALVDYDAHETPLGRIALCREAAALRDGHLVRDLPGADRGEHSLELQLPWLQETLGAFCIVPILVGRTDAQAERALAQRLAGLSNDRTLFVVSSDFVHYGERFEYSPFGDSANAARDQVFALENRAVELLRRKDAVGLRQFIATTGATICGYRGMLVLLEMLSKTAPEAQAVTFAHYSSGDLAGERDDSGSVGYVSVGYADAAPSAARAMRAPPVALPCSNQSEVSDQLGQALLGLARATLSTELRGSDDLHRAMAALPQTPRLDCRQAVFVTLKSRGQLRGCIGQVDPEYPLIEAVVRSALDSAFKDRRFEPVVPPELGDLSFELTILSVPRQVASHRDIVLGKHGIILSLARRRSLFLPQVPREQGWDLPETLRALSRKAGLDENAWSEPDARFSVFTGTVFEELPERPKPNPGSSTPDGSVLP